jgi:TPR repeat protein
MPGGPTLSAETQAALDKMRRGDGSDLVRLADSGKADAQAYAGVLLAFAPQPSPTSTSRGCAYLETASASRSDAAHFLGEAYQYGKCGGKADLERAAAMFRKAGDMGLAKSRCAEGNVLFQLGRDEARGLALCQEGAEKGDPDAQTDLANFYLLGQHVPKDAVVARGWYEKAAAQKQANAAHVLGQIYWNGDGVKRDIDRAAEFWRIAYDGGREDSAFHLGDVAWLKAGRGKGKWDPAGLAEARDWYAKAVNARNPEIAKEARERRDLADQLIGVMQRKGQ